MTIQNYPGSVVAQPWISGLLVSNDATTPNTKLNISAGICRDSNNIVDLTVGTTNTNFEGQYVAAPLVLNAATNGVNGLDQGTLAVNSFYSVYVIGDSTYQRTTACLLSLTTNSLPLMPTGYDSYRLVGYAVTNGSANFYVMQQIGVNNSRRFIYDSPFSVGTSSSTTYETFTISVGAILAVPVTENQYVSLYADYNANAAGNVFNASRTGNANQINVIAPVAGATAHTSILFDIQPLIVGGLPSFEIKMTAGSTTVYVNSFEFFV